MKTKLYTTAFIALVAGSISIAQNVGISASGVAPSGDAGLDVNFSDKGVLIPRVSLTNTGTYGLTGGGPTNSMLVYNTNTGIAGTGAMGEGYYYWDNTLARWIKLLAASSPSNAWLTLGNAGTTPGTHFVGTTDNVDLVFKTNNTEKMRILANGNVGIGTSAPISMLHIVQTITTDPRGIVIDQYNSGIDAPQINQRKARGTPSAPSAVLNDDVLAAWWARGHDGTAFSGGQAGLRMRAGENWTTNAHGTYITLETTPLGSTTLAERMRIDPAGNVGIGTTTPAQKLDVTGNVQFSGALMPAANAGTLGQVLTSQGAGTAPQWKSILMEAATGNGNFKICFGKSNAWQDCNGSNGCTYNTGILIDINMSGCGFTQVPYVFTSMSGTSNHWRTSGETSIYSLTNTSFRVYINSGAFGWNLNTSDASTYQYTLMWMAIGK